MQIIVRLKRLILAPILAAALAACAADPVPATPTNQPTPAPTETPPPSATTPSGELVPSVLYIDGIDIVVFESFPVQVTVVVRGSLADGCTTVGEITQIRDQYTFYVVINAVRPRDAICTDALVPFEQAIRLDVLGLPSGKYTIDVNGSRGEFELKANN